MPAEPDASRRRWSLLALAALAACLAGLLFVLFRSGAHRSEALAPVPEPASAATPRPASALEGPDGDTPERRESAAGVAQEPGPAQHPGLARLLLSVVDASTGEPLDRVRVRAASITRLADREVADSARIELALTPDAYELCVLSRGYEPVDLPEVRLAPGARVTLPPVRMSAGSARVLGLVNGAAAELRVELLGEGRRPCAQCLDAPGVSNAAERASAWQRAKPCAACGYSAGFTLRAPGPDGRFAFEGLVGGRYALRLVDAELHTVGLPQSFELRPGESLALECDAGLRTLELELLDVDGESLARVWADRLQGASAREEPPEAESVEWNGTTREFQCSFRAGEIGIARATIFPPAPPGAESVGVGFASGSASRSRERGGRPSNGADDRPRRKSELLRPESSAAPIPVPTIGCSVGGDGLVRFDPVPACALTLELSSGPFGATLELPPALGRERVRARLARDDRAPVAARTYREFETGGTR